MKNKLSILHLEDCLPDSELVEARLAEDGIPCDMARMDSRETFVHALENGHFDLILADYSLPGFDGLAALELALQKQPEVPFIFVSGAIGEDFAIEMVKRGATDYVLKNRLQRLGPAVTRAIHEARERAERKAAQGKLQTAYAELERRVDERTAELSRVNISLTSEIRERKKAESALRQSEQKMRHLYDTISDGIVRTDMEERVIECNQRYLDMLGYTEEEIKQVSAGPEWREKEAEINKQILSRGHSEEYEKEFRRKDGTAFPASIKKWPIRDAESVPTGMWAIVRDITERKKMEEEIRHMAQHDALTDLPNRRLLQEIIKIEAAQSKRHETKMALLLLDLDRFKEVNDTLGHEAGDELLKEVAERFKANVRESDTVSRTGGDEFTFVVADINKAEDAADVAQKIVVSLQKPFFISGHALHITTSVGISIYPDDGEDIDTLIRYADIAMYYAKEQGRNTFQFYNPAINKRSVERIRLESMLRQTAERGELIVYYQPQIDIKSWKITCSEALVRWNHPDLGLLEPKRFMGMAEETGYITVIDEWVLRTVCAQIRRWLDAGLGPASITVNLSAREFQNPNLVPKIAGILKEAGAPADYVDIEITESLAMSNIARTVYRLRELGEMGVRAVIDDFGTGYSSLSQLKRLPIQKLKIDQSFIKDIAVDPDDRAIISAVTSMAHSMKMKVVAEGVETEEQLEFLQKTGCDEMQGFLFSRPVTADGLEELFKAA